MKIICARLFFLAVCTLLYPLASWSQTIDVSLPDLSVTDQSEAILPITVGDVTGKGLNSFEFTVTYDSTVIVIDSVLTEDRMADGYLIIPNNPSADRIVVAAAGTSPLEGSGVLLSLRARFLKDGASDLHFDQIKFEPGQPPLNAMDGHVVNISLTSSEKNDIRPGAVLVSPNFPEPFDRTTRIALDLTEPAQVRVEIYAITGRLVRAYPARSFPAGPTQYLTIEAGGLPAGSYLYRVSTSVQGGVSQTTGTLTIIH